VAPQFAESFAALRRSLGRTAQPRLVVTTQQGRLEVSHGAVRDGVTVVTSPEGAAKLAGKLPEGSDVVVGGEGPELDIRQAFDGLRARGYRVILTEGGPRVMGHLLRAQALDEMFLTISPVVAGRDGDERPAMVEGIQMLPDPGLWTRLLSARRHGAFLFLRYGLRSS
jgi:riboflavin biosynthesis pyrimidine reductase